MEVSGKLHAPGHITPRERAPGTPWIGPQSQSLRLAPSHYTDWATPNACLQCLLIVGIDQLFSLRL
jgi:hypothetical protein